MDLKAARGSFFGAYLEGTCRKIAEARRREALILAKGLILNTFLVAKVSAWTNALTATGNPPNPSNYCRDCAS